MKKYIALLLALVIALCLVACDAPQPGGTDGSGSTSSSSTGTSSSSHTHSYTQKITDPDCTNSGFTTHTCPCGHSYQSDETPALGHSWTDATCTAPKTCTVCHITEGDIAAHNYQNGACVDCKAADPSFKALTSGKWECTKINNGMLVVQQLCFHADNEGMGPEWNVRYFEEIDDPDPDFMDDLISTGKLMQYKGKYYQHFGMGDMGSISFNEKGSTISVEMLYWDSSITVQRIAGDQLKVTAIQGDATVGLGPLKNGEVFIWTK